MEWYWWGAIALGVIVLLKLVFDRSKPRPPRTNEIDAIFQRSRSEQATADQELAKVVEVIADLFISPPNSAYANTLSRGELQSCVSNFMRQAGITGLHTNTKMLHVVMSPVQITALVRLKPTEPQAAVRDFIRIADNKWAFRTRKADDMERTIREADAESDRVVAMMKHAAATAKPAPAPSPSAAPSRPQSLAPTTRKSRPTDPAARIAADLSSAPLPRKLMNLLRVGPEQLEILKSVAERTYSNVKVVDLGSDNPGADILKTIARQISEGQVSADDLDWALRVDAIAGEAESAFRSGDVLVAIERYRDALQEAPGCDVYLMSMGTCYAELGALRDAVRYFERAAQISPQNARIARNLADARAALDEHR